VIIRDFLAIMGSKILNSSIKVIHPGTLLYWNVADKIRKFQGSCVYEDERKQRGAERNPVPIY
jgi:hypothetical protein